MSDLGSMNREYKKRQLRSRIVSSQSSPQRHEEDSEEIVRKARRKVRKKRFKIAAILIAVLFVAGIGLFQYFRIYQYTGYEVVWEKVLSEGSFRGCVSFGDNVLRYSKDGASYIDSQGKEIWVTSFEMKSPAAYVKGDFAAVADRQGNSIYIFDKSGNIGIADTPLPIIKATVSAHGVVAAILEDSSANYIYFYKRDGVELDTKIKLLLSGDTGYPVDISLSPDGTQLLGAYTYLKDGAPNGRVAFYNFAEIGKSIPDRLVGGFDEQYDSALVARVHFFDNTYSCAFADNSVSFFSTKNALSPVLIKQVMVEETIESVFYSDRYVGIIVNQAEGETPHRLEVYKPDGGLKFSKGFHFQYSHVDIDGDRVFLYNEDSCRIYDMSGRLKFEGTFDFPIAKMRNGRFPNTLIVTGPQDMKEIRLQ